MLSIIILKLFDYYMTIYFYCSISTINQHHRPPQSTNHFSIRILQTHTHTHAHTHTHTHTSTHSRAAHVCITQAHKPTRAIEAKKNAHARHKTLQTHTIREPYSYIIISSQDYIILLLN